MKNKIFSAFLHVLQGFWSQCFRAVDFVEILEASGKESEHNNWRQNNPKSVFLIRKISWSFHNKINFRSWKRLIYSIWPIKFKGSYFIVFQVSFKTVEKPTHKPPRLGINLSSMLFYKWLKFNEFICFLQEVLGWLLS